MNRNTLIALVAVLGFLVGAALLVDRSRRPSRLQDTPITGIPVTDITRVDLVLNGSTTTLASSGGAWRLTAPIDDRADRAAVERLLSIFPEVRFGSVLSENPERHARYEVNDASAAIVRVYVKGRESPAVTWLVGKQTADMESAFVRLPGSPEVRTAEGLATYMLSQRPDNLRSPALLPVPPAELDAIEASGSGVSASLKRKGETWSDAKSGQIVGGAELADLLAALKALRALALVTPDEESEKSLKKPLLTLSVSAGGQPSVVTIGAVARSGDSDVRFASVSDRPGLFSLPVSAGDALVAKFKELKS